MRAFEILAKTVDDRGISIAELARRVGMGKELVRRCLSGDRKIVAEEFISICEVLGLTLADFDSVERR